MIIDTRVNIGLLARAWMETKAKLPVEVQPLFEAKAFIAGGAVTSTLMGDEPKDVDFFFCDSKSAEAVIGSVLPGGLPKEQNFDPARSMQGVDTKKVSFVTPWALSMVHGAQFISKWTGEPVAVMTGFDFAHTKGFYSPTSQGVKVEQEALEAIAIRRLKYTGSEQPVSSLFRLRKFMQRGWKVRISDLLLIAKQISEYDLSDREVLRSQLVGVDVLYLLPLLNALQKQTGLVTFEYLLEWFELSTDFRV